ncbi:hypothetical protein [Niabella drilacis]|uniref:Outer membrane protein beta-barrel domain-containing protein n=1 Tax=Niabella drilacis (strain DSM 25811 / CCM 8410 / CCUG 62505 / LMG 26954 / E90) TaxID=1285928 RepID=A0A1G6KYH9_NIADE|nr:hypothetical protein [Niabella drilacis]SDC35973.1 hypothetical protein SAMN04487894_102148 [Niabella drilacis]
MLRYASRMLLLTSLLIQVTVQAQQLKTRQERGYFNITTPAEIQLMRSIDSAMLNDGNARFRAGFEFHTINGYFVNPQFSVGLGVGIQYSNYKYFPATGAPEQPAPAKSARISTLPLFADFRYYPRNSINGAMFLVNAGYAPALSISVAEHKPFLNGGAFMKLGAAYKFYLSHFISFVPSLNFKAQRYGDHTVAGGIVGFGFMF